PHLSRLALARIETRAGALTPRARPGEARDMRTSFSIRSLVLASAAHPRRTIAAWAGAAVLAIFAVVMLLGGSLSTDNHPTDNRQSQRAAALIDRSFPGVSDTKDAVVIRSDRYRANAPQFRALVGSLAAHVHGETAKSRVSADRHALLLPVAIAD